MAFRTFDNGDIDLFAFDNDNGDNGFFPLDGDSDDNVRNFDDVGDSDGELFTIVQSGGADFVERSGFLLFSLLVGFLPPFLSSLFL